MKYRVIQEQDRRYPIRLMCRALAVSAAGYYAWRSRPESARSVSARTVLSAIRVIHRESRETYGSPSIWDALRTTCLLSTSPSPRDRTRSRMPPSA